MGMAGGTTDAHESMTLTENLATVLPELSDLADNATDFLYHLINGNVSANLSDEHMAVTTDLIGTVTDITTAADITSYTADITSYAAASTVAKDLMTLPTPMKMVSHEEHSVTDDTCEAKMFTINLQVTGGRSGPYSLMCTKLMEFI